jgi:hypothetical protein
MNDYTRRMTEEARNYVQRGYERMRPHLTSTQEMPLGEYKQMTECFKAFLEMMRLVDEISKGEEKYSSRKI